MTAPVVDLAVLKALIGDDEAVIADVLRAFRDSAAELRAVLARSFATNNLRGVADAAHKLKSGARSIGAPRLAQRCSELEVAADSGKQDTVAALLTLFEADLRAVLQSLENH